MEFIIWILAVAAIAVIRSMKNGRFPRFPQLPDGRHDTPLGPSAHRTWPPKPSVAEPRGAGQRPMVSDGRAASANQRQVIAAEGSGEIRRALVTPTLYEPHETMHSTLTEPHETVHSTLTEPHESVREAARVSTSSAPASNSGRHRSPIMLDKESLVRAVVMAEILGPPRARQPIPGRSKIYKR